MTQLGNETETYEPLPPTHRVKPEWLVEAEDTAANAWAAYSVAHELWQDGNASYETVVRLEQAGYDADAVVTTCRRAWSAGATPAWVKPPRLAVEVTEEWLPF